VAERAGVRWIALDALDTLEAPTRTVYRFDVRTPEDYAAGHLPGFASAPGGQLVQETDHHVPVRGARIVLADDDGVRATMSASWLAQMGWEVYVVEPVAASAFTASGAPAVAHSVGAQRYRRPYEGTDASSEAMQAYLDWEFGLVDQLARDGTHHFTVV
jgi:rhodanese-related sulfurtransferase